MHWTLLICLAALLLQANVGAQEQGQQVQLTREMVEYLQRTLSPMCKAELDSALEAQGESAGWTTECQQEMSGILSNYMMQSQQGAASMNRQGGAAQKSGDAAPPAADAPKGNPTTVVLKVVGAVVALLVGLGLFGWYVYNQRSQFHSAKRGKGVKHEKKELQRQRLKGGR